MPASYEVTMHSKKAGVPFQNQFFVATGAADGTYAEAIEILSSVTGSSFYNDYLMVLPDDVLVEGVSVRSVVMVGGSATPSATAIGITGNPGGRVPAAGSGQTSNQNGPMISYLPMVLPGERPRTGKIFIPTCNESDAEDDVVGASLLTALGTVVTDLGSLLPVASGPLAWIGRIKKLVGPDVVSFARAILSAGTEEFVASQRRRRPKRL